jgi:hypothetical protein
MIVTDEAAKPEPPKPMHVPGTAIGKNVGPVDSPITSTPSVTPPSGIPPQTSTNGNVHSASLTADTAQDVVVQATPESKRAVDSLQKFFAAKNLAQRIPLTLGGANMKTLMERYYAKKDSGPISVDEIKLLRYDPAPDTGGGPHCVFTVASKQWESPPIPVMLQGESGAFKVDWLAFVEFRDNLLFEFLSGWQDVPARFHVGIRRTHYFEADVPDLDEKICFEIQPPANFFGYVFVPKNTPLAADLTSRIGWETLTAYVIVELRWKRLGEMKWVELTNVPQMNWYSFPRPAQADSDPQAKPAAKKSSGSSNVKEDEQRARVKKKLE